LVCNAKKTPILEGCRTKPGPSRAAQLSTLPTEIPKDDAEGCDPDASDEVLDAAIPWLLALGQIEAAEMLNAKPREVNSLVPHGYLHRSHAATQCDRPAAGDTLSPSFPSTSCAASHASPLPRVPGGLMKEPHHSSGKTAAPNPCPDTRTRGSASSETRTRKGQGIQ
jgi:hypothetical protein